MYKNENKSITTSFYMTVNDRVNLEYLSKELHMSKSELMRKLITYLHGVSKRKKAELLREHSHA